MSDHRIRQLRFYLFAAASVLLALWNPVFLCGLAWLPLGLFMPVFATATCGGCSAYPVEFQAVFTGIANGSTGTNCTIANTTYTVTWNVEVNANVCLWQLTLATNLECGAVDINRLQVRTLGTATLISSQFIYTNGSADNQFLGSTPNTNCAAYSGISLTDQPVLGQPFCCDYTAATCVITAL